MKNLTHIWRQYYRRWRLVQICDVKRLTLRTNVYWLKWIEPHLLGLRLRLTSNAHLLELLLHSLHARSWRLIACLLRWFVSCLWRTVLWRHVSRLSSRSLRIWVVILRLLRHAIGRLLRLLLLLCRLAGKPISSHCRRW